MAVIPAPSFKASRRAFSSLSLLPWAIIFFSLIRTLVTAWSPSRIIWDNCLHFKILHLITSAKSLSPCKVMLSQNSGIRTSLGTILQATTGTVILSHASKGLKLRKAMILLLSVLEDVFTTRHRILKGTQTSYRAANAALFSRNIKWWGEWRNESSYTSLETV